MCKAGGGSGVRGVRVYMHLGECVRGRGRDSYELDVVYIYSFFFYESLVYFIIELVWYRWLICVVYTNVCGVVF